jgi:hypothetical protein
MNRIGFSDRKRLDRFFADILYIPLSFFLLSLSLETRENKNSPGFLRKSIGYCTIFGKYGAVYQIRLGEKHKDTRGTAFVVYEDIYDAKAAVDHLSGFNVGGKYYV